MLDDPLNDAALLKSAVEGDVAAFETLLLWQYDDAVRAVRRQLSGEECRRFDAEDIVQQAFFKAHQSIDQLKATTTPEFVGWLRRICDTTLTDWRRARSAAKRSGSHRRVSFHGSADESSMSLLWDTLQAPYRSPSSVIASREELSRLERAIHALPPDENRLIHLRYLEQRPATEVASQLGTCGSTLARRCQNVLGRLRRTLQLNSGPNLDPAN